MRNCVPHVLDGFIGQPRPGAIVAVFDAALQRIIVSALILLAGPPGLETKQI